MVVLKTLWHWRMIVVIIVRFPAVDVGVEYANRLSAEEHDQVRSELRLQRSAPVHAWSSRAGRRVRATDTRHHRQLPSRAVGRALSGRDVRLRVQFRRLFEFTVADRRHIGCTSCYLCRVCTAAPLPWQHRCLCVVDQSADAVLDCP